jgi:acyl-CoA synthetase (AMP-forming)/AMP-acid ligase II
MLEDTRSPLLISREAPGFVLPGIVQGMIDPTNLEPVVDSEAQHGSPPSTDPDRVAYAMYTSGSTGQPKAVLVPHRGVVRLVRNANYLEVRPRRCFPAERTRVLRCFYAGNLDALTQRRAAGAGPTGNAHPSCPRENRAI